MTDKLDSATENPLVMAAAREYLAILESGEKPDRQLFLNRQPALIHELNECFDGIELAHAMKPKHQEPDDEPFSTAVPIGDFQIVRQIARGGMGIVYEAIQLSLGRRVALKVLPFAAALDQRHLQRFKIESQAAAQLHHTHIVPIYAVGSERGVHYYAMQLIEGRSLADLLAHWRESSSTGSANLATPSRDANSATQISSKTIARSETLTNCKSRWRQVAHWMADIADALEYAHSSGVIHRDVKPANILIDVNGRAWIADFGLAHVATDVTLTRSGELIGTLRYMSPEQASGQRSPVDHRTDVYSLGATLYELLTLKPIFVAEDRGRLLYQILHEDPPALRQANRSIPVELETIAHKAIAKSPSERYATAADMADDLRRFLSERPILARRPTSIDRLRKWTRRHPAYPIAAAILLLMGSIGLSIAMAVVWREQTITKQALQRERQRAEEAESRFAMARRAADELIELAEDAALDEPFQEGLRTRLLETALIYYQEFIDERRDRPADQSELEATRNRVQQILADLAVLRADRQYFLLREPTVLDDLQVSEKQRSDLRKVLGDFALFEMPRGDNMRGPPNGRGDGPRPDRGPRRPIMDRETMVTIARQHDEQLSAILTEQQQQRLNQIALQVQGVFAFRDYEVVKQLRLSQDQQEAIKRIQFDRDFGRRENRPGQFPGPDSRPPYVEQANAVVEQILTAEQRAAWQTMIGKPFQGQFSR